MPYCPKCDMEFVEGITKCSDCGGPLFESQEAAEAAQKAYYKKREEQMIKQQQMAMAAAQRAEQEAAAAQQKIDPRMAEYVARKQRAAAPTKAYVNKEQRYQDLKSSAVAFLIIGAATGIVAVLSVLGVISLPFTGIMKYIVLGMLIAMCVGSFAVAFSAKKSASSLKGEVAGEEKETEEIIEWFVSTCPAERIDGIILSREKDLTEEEMSLRRFDLIQDYLIINKDLPDASYVDALCDMIYSRLYEK